MTDLLQEKQEKLLQLTAVEMQYYKGTFVLLHVNCCQLKEFFF